MSKAYPFFQTRKGRPRDKAALTLSFDLSVLPAAQVLTRNLPSNKLQGINKMLKAYSPLQTLQQ